MAARSTQRLDERDIRILAVLAEEGRISKVELAQRVNLSTTPCWERLKRLEESGYIRGYRADVALEKIAASIVVFVVVELETHRAASFTRFEDAIAGIDEVTSCWAVGGGVDYLLQVITHDVGSYQRLIDDLLARDIGLVRYFTYIVTNTVKQSGTLPIARLLAAEQAEP